MNPHPTTLDLMRHGEPRGGHRFRGSLDDPLSDTGWAQMRAAVADHRPWDRIVSSPLARCRGFAAELAERHGLPLEIEPGLREIGFGEWEGLTAEAIEAREPGALARYWADPIGARPAGAEPLDAFAARVEAAWRGVIERYSGRHLLVVCHGGVIRTLLRHVLDMPLERIWRFDVPYAALSRVRVYPDAAPVLRFHCGRLGG